MSAANKRSNLKSGGTSQKERDQSSTPVPDGVGAASQEEQDNAGIASTIDAGAAEELGMEAEDNICFNNYMMKPSNIRDIWGTFKVKQNMFNYLQWYFRPRNSYDPERVDYNALNILAEYQTYNLEFLKNDLDLSDD